MSLTNSIMGRLGFGSSQCETADYEVQVQDGKIIGNPYLDFGQSKTMLTPTELGVAYERVSCVGTSIDLISSNMQMIEPVFWDDEKRESMEYPTDKSLRALRTRLERPNALDNRKSMIAKSVKSYLCFGAVYYAILLDAKNQIVSIKVVDFHNVMPNADATSGRISDYRVINAGSYNGDYVFNGRYYVEKEDKLKILAPFSNNSVNLQYLPASILQGCGLETLMYWYGCYHNKSLLSNGARPSLAILIKSLLSPKQRKSLKEDIRLRHSGAGNAGSAIIVDGAADKEIKQLSQNNKDMEFNETLKSAEESVYKRLGTNWILGKNINSKDMQKGMEMFFDMTVCPLFQSFFNHIFDVYKYYNPKYSNLSMFYLEQDIPALRPRFLNMMKDMPNLGIFTIEERRKMYNYQPLGDERDNELTVQTVKVTQSGNSGVNDTEFAEN